MSNARVVMNDTLRVFGLLAAIFSIPVILLLLMPEFPRWIARMILGL
jgi:hypothetical protein